MTVASHSPMFVLLSSYGRRTVIHGFTPCPISGRVSDTLWTHQISEDTRHPERQFHCQVKTSYHGE